jgi:hypothetical protein
MPTFRNVSNADRGTTKTKRSVPYYYYYYYLEYSIYCHHILCIPQIRLWITQDGGQQKYVIERRQDRDDVYNTSARFSHANLARLLSTCGLDVKNEFWPRTTKLKHDTTGQDKTRQDRAGQDTTGQDTTGHDNACDEMHTSLVP